MSTISTAQVLALIVRKLDHLSDLLEELKQAFQELNTLRSELKDVREELGQARQELAETKAQLVAARADIAVLKQGQSSDVPGQARKLKEQCGVSVINLVASILRSYPTFLVLLARRATFSMSKL